MTPSISGLDFFTAVHLLSRWTRSRAAVGEDTSPTLEAIRFFSRVAMNNLGDEVAEVRAARDDRPLEVEVRWLSMFGANGFLPLELTDRVMRAGRNGEAMREFVDSFLHRPLSLAYAASERLRPGAAYERSDGAPGWSKRDPYLAAALRAAGLFHLPDATADRLAGVLAPLARYVGTPAAVSAAATAHLGVSVRVQRPVRPPANTSGHPSRPGPLFTVVVGPMGWAEYRRFVPVDDTVEPDSPLADLLTLTRLFAGVRRFDVRLLLQPGEQPPADDSANGLRWVSDFLLDRGDRARAGVIPASECEHLLSVLARASGS